MSHDVVVVPDDVVVVADGVVVAADGVVVVADDVVGDDVVVVADWLRWKAGGSQMPFVARAYGSGARDGVAVVLKAGSRSVRVAVFCSSLSSQKLTRACAVLNK